MAHLYTSFNSGPPNMGAVYEKDDAGNLKTAFSGDPTALNKRTVALKYRRHVHLIGTFRRPFVRDQFGGYHLSGVRPPLTKPTLTDGSFSSGSTGNAIAYQTFLMKVGDLKIVESNPGPPSSTLAMAGTGRLWDNLDWSPVDDHVTHSRGYISVDGSIPALAWEVPLKTTGDTVSENVDTAGLGETLPVKTGISGGVEVDLYARGVVPYTQWAEEYHNTFFYAGDPNYPERIYYSKLYEPEAVNTTPIQVNGRIEYPWLETTDGQPVTGIKRQGDELLVGTFRGIDVIQRYAYGDYSIRRLSNYWGVVSHFSMRRCGPLDSLFFLAPQGPTTYNSGHFRFIGEPIQSWWRDWFRANPVLAQDAYGTEDRFWETYNLLLTQSASPYSYWLVVDFNEAEKGRPIWVFDIRARKDWVSDELAVASSASYYERYTGSCDGEVRQENDLTDADDDSDTYQKKYTVQPAHRFPEGDQAGDDMHGHQYTALELYLRHDNQDATVSMYAGDDYAPDATTPQWTRTLDSTALAASKRQVVSRTSRRETLSLLTGKGVTMKVEVTAPVDVEFRGWGVEYVKGRQERPFS